MNDTVRIKKSKEEIISAFRLMIAKKKAWEQDAQEDFKRIRQERLSISVWRWIVEAFFEANPDILLYICETGDDKQRFRNRLFVRWFNNYSRRDEFVLKTAEVLDESVVNFAAMIVQRSNPRLNGILNDFDETIALLQK